MLDVGALVSSELGLPWSFGYGINGAGHVAGTAYDFGYSTRHAFVYNGVTVTNIGTLGGTNAEAFAINNNGCVVGYSFIPGNETHAFRFQEGVMTDLGKLGGTFSEARAINNNNVIVGNSTDGTTGRAFIMDSNTMVDLNTRLDGTGTGWTLEQASGINDAGQVVGVGSITGGVARAYLLTPVPPRITAMALTDSNVLVSFTTQSNSTYGLRSAASPGAASWSNASPVIAGNGGIRTATNFGATTLPLRFYRINLDVP